MTNPQPEATITFSNDPPASIASGNYSPPLLVLSPHTSSRAPLAWAADSIREFGTNPGVHPLAHPVACTIQGLIIQATNAKAQAMAWQQRIATNGGYPYSQTYAQECADWWQKRLVHLLTLIIAGDEPAIAAAGDTP